MRATCNVSWFAVQKDLGALRRRADGWMREEFAFRNGFEMHYQGIERRLFAEQYLENADGDMPDFKLWCFDGRPRFVQYLSNRARRLTMTFYDLDWNVLPFAYDHPRHDCAIDKPEQLGEMVRVAEALARGFAHVRVDLYLLDGGEVKFSELTFTSASGVCRWDPPETDMAMGDLYHLP